MISKDQPPELQVKIYIVYDRDNQACFLRSYIFSVCVQGIVSKKCVSKKITLYGADFTFK